ncbi:MAG: hypothetical protein ACC634_03175 [Hyphomicrobiales bacterium]
MPIPIAPKRLMVSILPMVPALAGAARSATGVLEVAASPARQPTNLASICKAAIALTRVEYYLDIQ